MTGGSECHTVTSRPVCGDRDQGLGVQVKSNRAKNVSAAAGSRVARARVEMNWDSTLCSARTTTVVQQEWK